MQEIKKHRHGCSCMAQAKSIVWKYINNMRHNETNEGSGDFGILIDISVNNIFKSHVHLMKKNPIKETVTNSQRKKETEGKKEKYNEKTTNKNGKEMDIERSISSFLFNRRTGFLFTRNLLMISFVLQFLQVCVIPTPLVALLKGIGSIPKY